jgi:hypothetical protein
LSFCCHPIWRTVEAGKHKFESLTINGGPFRLHYIAEADLPIDSQHD